MRIGGHLDRYVGSLFLGSYATALFLVVGVVYDRIHSREIARYGGLVHRMPIYAFTFMVFMMASVGLPGTGGFVGEVLVLVGVFQVDTWVAALATTGLILGAVYMLWLYRRVIFGLLEKEDLRTIADMNRREIAVFAPLLVVTILMGVWPAPFLDVMHLAVEGMVGDMQASIRAAAEQAAASSALASR